MNNTSPLEPIAPIGSESPGAYEAFLVYFELGPNRTLKQAAEILDLSENSLKDWSSRYSWRQRIREYRAKLMTQQLQPKAIPAEAPSQPKPTQEPALQATLNTLGGQLLHTSHNLFHYQLLNNAEKINMAAVLKMMRLGERLINSARAIDASKRSSEPAHTETQPPQPPPA